MKKIILIMGILCVFAGVNAQYFNIPENYVLEEKSDYVRYNDDIIRCINWLANTPVNQAPEKRKAANAFLLQWISGCPYVHVVINSTIVNFINEEESAELLMVFLGGWIKNTLTERNVMEMTESMEINEINDEEKINGNEAGVIAVIDFYQKNKSLLPKNDSVEKYIKMQQKGKLRNYIEKNYKK